MNGSNFDDDNKNLNVDEQIEMECVNNSRISCVLLEWAMIMSR